MGYCRCTLLEALNGVRHWVAAVKKLNKRPVSVLQFYTASTIHSFWQKNSMKKPDKLRLFTPNLSAFSLYRRQERRGLSGSGHCCLTRSTVYSTRARKQVKACFSRLLSSSKKSCGFCSLIVSFFTGVLFTFNWEYIVSLSYHQLFAGYWAQWQCCQVLWSIYGHIRQKPRPFSKLSRPALGLPFKKLKN
jgi:hypothetical protein